MMGRFKKAVAFLLVLLITASISQDSLLAVKENQISMQQQVETLETMPTDTSSFTPIPTPILTTVNEEQTFSITNGACKVVFNGRNFVTNSLSIDFVPNNAIDDITLVPMAGFALPEEIVVNGMASKSVTEDVYGINYDSLNGTISGIPTESLLIQANALVDDNCAIASSTDTTANLLVDIGESNEILKGIAIKTGNNEYGELIPFKGNAQNGKALFELKNLTADTTYTVQARYSNDNLGKTFTFSTRPLQPTGINSVFSNSVLHVNGINGLQTTYSNRGWGLYASLHTDVQRFVSTYNLSQNVNEVTVVLRNNGSSALSDQCFAFHADVQIGYNDHAPISNVPNQGFLMTDGVNKLYMINQGNGILNGKDPFGGSTPATITKWWGYYNSRSSYLFQDLVGHADLSGTDSGAAFSWQKISLEPGETKVFTFKIAAGSYESEDLIDLEAPTEPTSLRCESKDTENIKIAWDASTDNNGVAGYKVYRNGILIKTITENFYEDTGLIPGTRYIYAVRAYDLVGNTSNPSEGLEISTLIDNEAPSIISIEPANGSVIGKNTQVVVKAADNIRLESIKLQYAVEDSEQWNDIDTIKTLSSARFSLENLQVNGIIKVRAVAYDRAKNESESNIIRTYTRDTIGPEKVVNIRAESSSTSILLNWDDVSDDDLSYFQVERKNEDGTYTRIGRVSNARGMNVTGLNVSTSYTFRVVAYDKVNNRGIESDDMTFTTTADNNAPVVTYIGPRPARFSETIPLRVNVSDDVGAVKATFQISSNGNDWDDLETILGKSNSFGYSLDVSGLSEGKYYIRCLVSDEAGNISNGKPVNEYIVDKTGPSVPENLLVAPNAGYIDLTWSQNTEIDFRYYKIYRSINNEPYVLIANNYRYLSYKDRDVLEDVKYKYKLTAVDSCGNEGEAATSEMFSIVQDIEAPKIISASYADGSTLPANPVISILAEDNYMLESIELSYKLDSDEKEDWTTINAVTSIDKYSDIIKFTWDTTGLSDDVYVVRAIATDKKGNISNPYIIKYNLNLQPPAAPVVTAVPGGWKVNLSWTASPEVDVAGYHILRSSTIDGAYTLLTKTTNTTYEDSSVVAGNTYYYIVDAVDKYYNVSKSQKVSAIPTNEDHEPPTAVINCVDTVLTGDSIVFDGTSSTDNNQIKRVVWDFGNGTTSESLKVTHTYDVPSEYTVVLSVYDPADNVNTTKKIVTVHPYEEVSEVEVKVVDDVTGNGVGNASVVINNADGTVSNLQTDSNGIVNIVTSFKQGENTGIINVYAFKQDYLPSKIDRTVIAGQPSNIVISIGKGDLVKGELTVKRMTLDEIKKANINISAPENQYVYEFTVHLGYPVVVNSRGEILSNSTYTITNNNGSTTTSNRVYISTIPSSRPEVPPAITYMEVPGEMTMLKEFFNVNLTVENMAKDSEFKIENSIAKLNLPAGLTLVNSEAKVNLTPSVIPGGSKGTASWIIRGDNEGEYDISADFSGILQPFNEIVTKRFESKEKIKVYGTSGITIHCEAEDYGYKNDPYLIRFGVENTTPTPRYNLAFTLKDGVSYKYKEGQQLKQSITELKPNEIQWFEYWILPTGDSAGPLDLKETFAFNTSNDSVEWKFVSIPRVRGDGFAAWYFESKDLCGTYKQKMEEEINFDWGEGSPDPAIDSKEFSARWQATVIPKYQEEYTIRVESNQSVRVFVDGNKVIDTWYTTEKETELTATIPAGKSYNLDVQFSKAKMGSANIKVLWSSKSQPEEVIPTMYSISNNYGNIFAFMVLEHLSENAVNDAKVSLLKEGQVVASTTTKTEDGTSGIAYFSPEKGKYKLLVEKDGYYPYEVDVEYYGGQKLHTLVIDLIENDIKNDPYIIAVFDETNDWYVNDLAISPSVVTVGSSEDKKINIMVNWNGQRPGKVVLYQKDNLEEISSTSGIINEKLGQKLIKNGQPIYAYGITSDGTRKTQLYEIKLIVVEPPAKPDGEEGDEEVKDLIPPLPGFELPFTSYGMFDNEYKFKIGNFTFWQKRDETNIIIGQSKDEVKDLLAVGINNFQGKMDVKNWSDIKNLLSSDMKNTAGNFDNPSNTIRKWKEKYSVLDTKKTPGSTNLSFDSTFYLYGERTKNSNNTAEIYKDEFGFLWLGSAAVKYEQQIFIPTPVVVIPCLLTVQGQGKVEARAYYVRDYRAQKQDVAVKVRPEFSVEAGFGPGMAKVWSLQVVGQLGVKGQFERFVTAEDLILIVDPSISQIDTIRGLLEDGMFDNYYVRGFGKVGFKASLFMFEWKHYPFEGEVELLKYPA